MTPEEIGRLRVGDAEREQAVTALGDHFTLGRLSDHEYSERLDAVWSSKTRADLDALFHDLPTAPPAVSVPVPVRSSKVPAPLIAVLAVLGILALVGREPVLVLILLVVAFVVLKQKRRRDRRSGSQPYWR